MFAKCLSVLSLLAIGCLAGLGTGCTQEEMPIDSPVANDSEDDGDDTAKNQPEKNGESNGSEKVLRHAVFFKFKETASEDDVAGVVEAFRALPSKIEAIQGFEWGTNNSPEGLDDGFTHCFLLTFEDEAGRKEYLPHPDHKAFGEVLGPHMEDVFVIDYWGKAETDAPEKQLRHAVFFKFKDDATDEQVREIEEAFAELPSKIDAIKGFEWGKNNSPEGHDDGFTHCFLVTFDSEEAREEYLPHPDHKAFVKILKPVLDKVRVLDYWAQE